MPQLSMQSNQRGRLAWNGMAFSMGIGMCMCMSIGIGIGTGMGMGIAGMAWHGI